jgi:quercetin dioxygenase-like cupin family protein
LIEEERLHLNPGSAMLRWQKYLLAPLVLLLSLCIADSREVHTVSASTDGSLKATDTLNGMLPSIQSFNTVKEVKYPWGWIRWMMNSELDRGAEQTFGIVQINAGQRNPLHKHPNCEELLYVLSGSFENVMNGKTVVMHAGDIVRIPANTPHQGINNTKEPMRAVISYSSGTRQMVALEAQTE